MGDARGEGFFPPLSTVVSQRMQDDSVREHQHDKTHCADGPTVGHQQCSRSYASGEAGMR